MDFAYFKIIVLSISVIYNFFISNYRRKYMSVTGKLEYTEMDFAFLFQAQFLEYITRKKHRSHSIRTVTACA